MMVLDGIIFSTFYFIYFFPKWRKKELFYHTLFYVYLIALFLITLSPFFTSLTTLFQSGFQPMLLEPFRDIIAGYAMADLQIFLNILLFLPFGFLLPTIRNLKCRQVVFNAFLLSFFIEVFQPVINSYRKSDITDIICNTLGGLIGYGLYYIYRKMSSKS